MPPAAVSSAPIVPVEAIEPPDWSAIHETIACPLCGYNLRGLSEPRCPECGRTFIWSQLTDPAQRLHPYLFEHHPERNVWSFVRTLAGGLIPWRFWRTLQPQQPSRPRRLIAYWMTCVMLALLAGGALYFDALWQVASYNAMRRQTFQVRFIRLGRGELGGMTADEYRARYMPVWGDRALYSSVWTYTSFREVIVLGEVVLCAWVLWPWASMGVFVMLGTSMRQARVRHIHVMRVMLYSFDAVAWIGILLFASVLVSISIQLAQPFAMPQSLQFGILQWLTLVLAILSLIRLFAATRLYLRIRHAEGVVVASQVLAGLALLTVLGYLLPDWTFGMMNGVSRSLFYWLSRLLGFTWFGA